MSEFTARYLSDYAVSDFSIKSVNLTVKLSNNATQVTSVLEIERINSDANSLILDGEHLVLKSVLVDEELLSPESYLLTQTHLTIPVTQNTFRLTISTEIDPENNTALEGLFKSGDAFCTQCEAEGFRRITYYLDRPDVMSVFTTTVIADKQKYPFLLANGNKIDEGNTDDGMHYVTWHDPFPKPAYLFALVAGDFDLLTDKFVTLSGRSVDLEIFVDKGNLHKAEHAMASLKKSMAWDEQVFGLEYDLDIYMIVAVDFFNMGAMENKGLNVFNSKYVLADEESATDTDYFNIEAVIAHEYFHNWTGNRVTCRDWFQLSLKEGLTVFRDQQFSADMHSAPVTRIQNIKVMRAMQFAEDAGPMAHPIRPEKVMEMNNFYTLTVYEKGSEVIRMIHTLLGSDGFRAGMDLYFKRFDGMAVTCDDFVDAMADATGKDLSLFKRWYAQSGTPELEVDQEYDEKHNSYRLTITQHHLPSSNQPEKLDLHIPINIELIDKNTGKATKKLLELTSKSNTWEFDVLAKPVVAVLANFSAPVRLKFNQTNDELMDVIALADDYFCRWDAAQKIMHHYIKELTQDIKSEIPQSFFDLLDRCITDIKDNAFKALILTLPSFDEMALEIEQVNAESLCNALDELKKQIAINLTPALLEAYQQCIRADLDEPSAQVANRALQNVCLSYLSVIESYQPLVVAQFKGATNMTESLGALNAAATNDIAMRTELMADFEGRWYDTTLVMDKWFTLSAAVPNKNIYQALELLMQRDDFSMNNPNRARALIGAFVSQNPRYFHDNSGQGYAFLADRIIELNTINPQVASRLITALIQFKAFDLSRQKLMIGELNRIQKTPNLAKDLVEKLDAALG